MEGSAKDITTLLMAWSNGNREALDELTPLVYNKLRQVAARELRRETPGQALQSTELVHEAYLKLVDQTRAHWQDREHFYAVAAQMIRRILVSHARSRNSAKRGGGQTVLALDEPLAPAKGKDVDLVALDDALETLLQMDPQQGRIVELRFFAGLSIEATARVLDVSPATVNRDWRLAKLWLYNELNRRED
jgi:RNA polymerase sigma factor (TIGR02999 family)